MANRRITPASDLAISLPEIQAHLNEFDEAQNDTLNGLIMTATEDCENRTHRSIMRQTREETLDKFPGTNDFIELPYSPVLSIESVKYLDPDGNEQTLAPGSYYLDNAADDMNAYLAPSRGRDWPETYDQINSVRVRYIAGYESAAAIPYPLRQWIKIKAGDLYANRESVNVGNITSAFDYVDKMLDDYTIF